MYSMIDAALTCAAEFVLFGSFVYFPIAFVVYAWQAETKKADAARSMHLEARWAERKHALAQTKVELAQINQALSETTAQLQPTQEKLAQVEADLALIAKVLPLLHQEKAALAAQLESGTAGSAGDEDAIAPSGVPSTKASELPVPLAISVESRTVEVSVGKACGDDAGAGTSTEVPATVPPSIAHETLTIWTRRNEKVVPTDCIPVPIPGHIQRLRWRNVEVMRLADLEGIVVLV